MSQDFKNIAEQAIAQCEGYEARIAELQGQLSMSKQANAIDQALVKKSVEALVKIGSINESQAEQACSLLSQDRNASFRAIEALCAQLTDAPSLIKTESADIEGGTLVDAHNKRVVKQASVTECNSDAAYTQVARILGLKLN